MDRNQYVTPMVEEVLYTGERMRKICETSFTGEMVADVLKDVPVQSLKRVILTGCGDSYASGVAAVEAFEALTGLTCETPSAVDFSRYLSTDEIKNSLVIINSISGGVSRVIEDAMRANRLGAYTIALTGDANAKLAQECKAVFLMRELPNRKGVEPSPKVLAYTASVVGLMDAAITLGALLGRYDSKQEEEYRSQLHTYVTDTIEKNMDQIDEEGFSVAQAFKNCKSYMYLGEGCEFGSVLFGAFKWPESMGRMAMWDDTENWNHVNYFQKDIDSVGSAVVVRADSPSMSRAKETVEALCNLGRSVVVVTDGDEVWPEKAFVCRIPRAPYPWMASAQLHLPLSLFAAYVHGIIRPPFIPYRTKGGLWEDPGASRLTMSELVEI